MWSHQKGAFGGIRGGTDPRSLVVSSSVSNVTIRKFMRLVFAALGVDNAAQWVAQDEATLHLFGVLGTGAV